MRASGGHRSAALDLPPHFGALACLTMSLARTPRMRATRLVPRHCDDDRLVLLARKCKGLKVTKKSYLEAFTPPDEYSNRRTSHAEVRRMLDAHSTGRR